MSTKSPNTLRVQSWTRILCWSSSQVELTSNLSLSQETHLSLCLLCLLGLLWLSLLNLISSGVILEIICRSLFNLISLSIVCESVILTLLDLISGSIVCKVVVLTLLNLISGSITIQKVSCRVIRSVGMSSTYYSNSPSRLAFLAFFFGSLFSTSFPAASYSKSSVDRFSISFPSASLEVVKVSHLLQNVRNNN